MFCPEGFETLATTYRRCEEIAYYWSLNQPRINENKFTGLLIDTGLDEEYRRGGYQEWLWLKFARFSFNKLFACSPNGLTLKLDVVSGRFASHLTSFEDFPTEIEEQKKLCELYGDIYTFLTPMIFSISVTRQDDDDEFDYSDYKNTLGPLTGWPVCWKRPVSITNNTEFIEILSKKLENSSPIDMPTTRPRGAPPIGEGLVQRAIETEFRNRLRKGLLPSDQKEATYADAIAWARDLFGKEISRSTIQRYLLPVFAAMGAQKSN